MFFKKKKHKNKNQKNKWKPKDSKRWLYDKVMQSFTINNKDEVVLLNTVYVDAR